MFALSLLDKEELLPTRADLVHNANFKLSKPDLILFREGSSPDQLSATINPRIDGIGWIEQELDFTDFPGSS